MFHRSGSAWAASLAIWFALLGGCGGEAPSDGRAVQPAPVSGGVAATSQVPAEEKVLHVYNWSDYIAPDTVRRFEVQTGIKVIYDVYDSNEFLETKMLTGKSGYDIVVPSGRFLERQAKAGVFRTLDKARLPNFKNLDPEITALLAKHDPANAHGVPYMWGTTGIAYNRAKVKSALGSDRVRSWSVVLDPANAKKLKECGIAFIDAPAEVIDSALIFLGRDPNSERPEDLAAAENVLMMVRPFVRYFDSSRYIEDLANGEICIAIGWSGDAKQAHDRAQEAGTGADIAYAIPKEGSLVWLDSMAIPADAPHPGNAHAFLNFILRPDIAAAISNYTGYPSSNAAAISLIDPSITSDPFMFPRGEVRSRLKPQLASGIEYERLETRAWQRIQTGQ